MGAVPFWRRAVNVRQARGALLFAVTEVLIFSVFSDPAALA
jgi:hypothetical protein